MNPDPAASTNDPLFGNSVSDLMRAALDTETAQSGSAATPWNPPTPEHLAEMLPQFQITALIGRGGMGAVYHGVQLSLHRPVAIKLLPAELAAAGDFVSRFQREARTLAQLQHPGIVAVYDSGRTSEGHLYFIMEFVDGTDLQRVIHSPGLEPRQALELTLQICEALQYAHSQGVIHRDIKPANVLLTQDGRAKLADFGLARPLTTTPGLTSASLIMGTPDYMAPEQWAGKVDHRADIYALGVMLYEMLTGTRPQGAFDLPSIISHVDARLDEVVVKAMRQAPDQRYQKVSELRDAVQHIRTTRPPRQITPQSQMAAPHPVRHAATRAARRRHSSAGIAGWAVAIVLLFAVAAAIMWVLRQEQGKKAPALAAAFNPTPPAAVAEPKPEIPSPKPEPVTPPKPAPVAPTPPPPTKPMPAAEPTVGITPPPSVTAPAKASLIEIFTRESQNLIAWALAPMEETVPPDIRQKLTYLREDLIDEGKTKPAASLDAYRAAFYLCEDLLTALNERDQARVAAGYRAAQSNANQPVSTQALDARRNYMMSWPQYSREDSQRSALQSQNQARTAVSSEAQKVAWAAKVERLRTLLDTRYRSFRTALRQ